MSSADPKFIYALDIENLDFNHVKQYLSKWSGEMVNMHWMRSKLIKKFGQSKRWHDIE